MNMADVIKKCAVDAFDASVPCDVVFGEVTGTKPLCIKAGEMELDENVVILAEHLKYKECSISLGVYTRTVVIHDGIAQGDNIVLIRKRGGESYAAVAKI